MIYRRARNGLSLPLLFHLAQYDCGILDFHISALCIRIRKRVPLFGRFTLPIHGTVFPIHVHVCATSAGFYSWTGSPFPGVRCYLSSFTSFWITWTGESFFVPSVSEILLAHHNPSHHVLGWLHGFESHVCLDLGVRFPFYITCLLTALFAVLLPFGGGSDWAIPDKV